jgi:hypothetical protein
VKRVAMPSATASTSKVSIVSVVSISIPFGLSPSFESGGKCDLYDK